MRAGRHSELIVRALVASFVLVTLFSLSLRSQINFDEPDIARIAEGDVTTRNTAQFLINRDLFAREAINTGRRLFHHDFARDKEGGCNGLPCARRHPEATRAGPQSQFEASSCATCHSTPVGSAGFGPKEQNIFKSGNTVRTTDIFGGGLIQQLAFEATADLKAAKARGLPHITSNGINYDTGLGIRGGSGSVNLDLVIRPFGRKGIESHLRAFSSRVAFARMGLQAQDRFQCSVGDPDNDGRCNGAVTRGLDPDGDGIADELTQGTLSLLEQYLVNYPVPGRGPITGETIAGERIFKAIGCAECHLPELRVREDPRIEHVSVFWHDQNKRFEAERRFLYHLVDDGYLDPDRRRPVPRVVPNRQPFVVALYADLKRHEMGPRVADASDENGVQRSVFITRPLWGVGSYTAYLSDGSAGTIEEAILRHGGESLAARNKFAGLPRSKQAALIKFLKSLILFSVEDVQTAKIPITKGDIP